MLSDGDKKFHSALDKLSSFRSINIAVSSLEINLDRKYLRLVIVVSNSIASIDNSNDEFLFFFVEEMRT